MTTVFNIAFKTFGNALPAIRKSQILLEPLILFQRGISMQQMMETMYASILFTCFVFLWYGLGCLDQPKGTIYRSGIVDEDTYVPIFLFLAPNKVRNKIMGLYVPLRTLFVVFTLCSSFSPSDSDLKFCCAVGASVLAILTYCYRLMIIKLLMKRKTVRFTPFILCFFMFSTALSCFISSIHQKDIFAAIPNGFASFLGAWQLILYAKYRLRVQPAI